MSDAKVEFSFDGLSFTAEGDKSWIAEQLDKVLAALPPNAEMFEPTLRLDSHLRPENHLRTKPPAVEKPVLETREVADKDSWTPPPKSVPINQNDPRRKSGRDLRERALIRLDLT